MPRSLNRRDAGFGVLEALVALVLLSSVGFVLLGWVQQNLEALQRMQGFYAEQEARRDLVEWSRGLNPMARPSGETVIGNRRIVWDAAPAADAVTQAGYPAGTGLYDLALYEIRISVYRTGEGSPWFTERMTAVGYRKARESRTPFN
ncbi:MAG: hypothetical protein KJZ92_04505 [Rhodocyclaceae bacterium]|nr:hypothetical protein [Rhodocyclaceae bacterium]